MKNKLRQFVGRWRYTPSNRLPVRTSGYFLINTIRSYRRARPAPALRAAIGFTMRRLALKFSRENRVAPNTICFLTGRTRGTSKRHTLTRLRYRHEAASGLLFGLRKSSW